MKREAIFVKVERKRVDDICSMDWPEKMGKHYEKLYNQMVHTNSTVKKPFNCPHGRKKCTAGCSKQNHSNERNKEMKKELQFHIRDVMVHGY